VTEAYDTLSDPAHRGSTISRCGVFAKEWPPWSSYSGAGALHALYADDDKDLLLRHASSRLG